MANMSNKNCQDICMQRREIPRTPVFLGWVLVRLTMERQFAH